MRTKLKGKSWTVTRRRRPGGDNKYNGWADFKRKSCYIHPDLNGKDLTETIIHEVCHIHFPDLDEDMVKWFAIEATRVLERLG